MVKLYYYKPEHRFLEAEQREVMVSEKTKAIWAIQLDIITLIADICRRHSIRWFVDGGTLLGAVRHQGFIPWDDDIDICMFREDYERFCEICCVAMEEPFFLQTYRTDVDFTHGHAQVRRSDTTFILRGEMEDGKPTNCYNQGICVDLFPMDNIPDNPKVAERFLRGVEDLRYWACSYSIFQRKFSGKSFFTVIRQLGKRLGLRYYFTRMIGLLIGRKPLRCVQDRHDAYVQKYNKTKTERACTISHWPMRKSRQYYRREWFDNVEMLKFENLTVPAPSGYEQLLAGLYGDDWRTPRQGSALLHGDVLVDVDHSYTDYFDKNG